MLNEEELRDAGLLVFANKQDQPGAKGAGEISEALNLGELRDRNWSIVACSAVDGRGVDEGMDWLVVGAILKRSVVKDIMLTTLSKLLMKDHDIMLLQNKSIFMSTMYMFAPNLLLFLL